MSNNRKENPEKFIGLKDREEYKERHYSEEESIEDKDYFNQIEEPKICDRNLDSNPCQILSHNFVEELDNEYMKNKRFDNAIEVLSNFQTTNENWQIKYLSKIDLSLIDDYVYHQNSNWLLIFFKSYDSKFLYSRNTPSSKNYVVTEELDKQDIHCYKQVLSKNLIKSSVNETPISEVDIKIPYRVRFDILGWISWLLFN